MSSLRALGLLLCYPDPEWLDALDEIEDALAKERRLGPETREGLRALIRELDATPLLDLQERYVAWFDRTPRLSLHLYEHVHGDARERGQAMAELQELYRAAGFELDTRELPDHLPALCELASLVEPAQAHEILAGTAPLLDVLRQRLARAGSPHAAVLTALHELATGRPTAAPQAGDTADAVPPSFEELDAAWAESPVRFGPGEDAAPCPTRGRERTPLLQIDRGGAS